MKETLSDTTEEDVYFYKLKLPLSPGKGLLVRKLEFLFVHRNTNSSDAEM